jgi:transcriptional regulator with XRE-family HTH domain
VRLLPALPDTAGFRKAGAIHPGHGDEIHPDGLAISGQTARSCLAGRGLGPRVGDWPARTRLSRPVIALYSKICYSLEVSDSRYVLREVMLSTGTSQSELSRLSGVWQSSISQFLSGRIHLSDEQLDRLLSCMGYRLEVVWRPALPDLTRSEWRSWRLHRRLSTHLTRSSLEQWRPTIERNLERLRSTVRGQPHLRNLDRWESLVDRGDVLGFHRIFTGLDRDSIEMREVSPAGGLLPNEERLQVLQMAG